MRTPVSWNQYWMPKALKAGVRFVDGDHYWSANAGSKGVVLYFSGPMNCWIRYNPSSKSNEGKPYRACEIVLKKGENIKGVKYEALKTEPWPGDKGMSQAQLAAEFKRVEALGYGDKDKYGIRSQAQIVSLVKEQGKEPEATPVVEHPVDQALNELKAQVWTVFDGFLHRWEFSAEDRAEMEAEMAAIGIFPPAPEPVLVSVALPRGMTQDQLTELLSTHQIEVTEIS